MVGNYTHCNVNLCIVAICLARYFADSLDYWLENIGIIVRLLALESHTKTLKTHTGINYLCREFL